MRSQPENTTKWLISLIADIVDPRKQKGKHPPMSVALEKVLSAIQQGAEEQLEVLKGQKKKIEEGDPSSEVMPKLIVHIEKVEEEEFEEEQGDDTRGGAVSSVKEGDIGDAEHGEAGEEGKVTKQTHKRQRGSKAAAEETDDPKKKLRVTQSVTKLKEQKRQEKIKEQERRWKETKSRSASEAAAREVDLEEAMMSPEEEGDQEGYGKKYMKTHEKRGERSVSRVENREQDKKKKKEEAAKKAAKEEAYRIAVEEVKCIIERAQLKEEELAVQKRLEREQKLRDMAEEEKELEETTDKPVSKQQWKEKLGLKARKHKCDKEEEYQEIDDVDKDKDYDPDDNPEADFVMEDADIDEEDTFEIEKHAINLQQAGDYVIEIRKFVECFSKVVRKVKVDVAKEYRKLIHFMKEMVLKIRSYGPIEHADEEAVFKTIVDPTCTEWRCTLHGAKIGNSKELQRIKDRRLKVEKLVEDCERRR